jgi:MFS family permease
MKKNALRKTIISMRSMYFILCGSVFFISNFMPIYLRSLSFTSDVTVGLIMSLGFLITTVSQPVVGAIADHAATKNRVMRLAILGVAFSLWLLILPKHASYLTLIPCVTLVYATFTIPMLLADTIVVENLDSTGIPFGVVKSFSSGGAAAAALFMFLLSLSMTLKPFMAFFLAFICAMLSLIPLHFVPATKGHAHGLKGKKENMGPRAILKNRRLLLLLFYILFLFMPIQATNVFLGIYYATDQGLNAGMGMYGLFNGICIALETCTMLIGNRIWSRMNIYHLFVMVALAAGLRSLIAFLAPNVYVIQLSAIGHVFLFAPLWSRLTPYVNSIVTKEMRATGQAAWSIMSAGVGPTLGSALGGFVSERFGIRNLFLAAAVMLFLVAVVFHFLFKRQQTLDRTELNCICDPV